MVVCHLLDTKEHLHNANFLIYNLFIVGVVGYVLIAVLHARVNKVFQIRNILFRLLIVWILYQSQAKDSGSVEMSEESCQETRSREVGCPLRLLGKYHAGYTKAASLMKYQRAFQGISYRHCLIAFL